MTLIDTLSIQRIALAPAMEHQQCFHELFARQAARSPERPAIWFQGTELTYYEMNARANQVARFLQGRGVGPETVVGLCLERGEDAIETFVAMLGILKAGGAYLTLNPGYPRDWLQFIVRDAGVALILTQSRLAAKLSGITSKAGDCPLLSLDEVWQVIAEENTDNPHHGASLDTLAYVIYTSGTSTGKPKGVLVEHRWLGAFAATEIELCGIMPSDTIAQSLWLGFDASIIEFATAWLAGATLCPIPSSSLPPGPLFTDFLQHQRIAMFATTPSILAALPDVHLPDLKTIVVGGEALPTDLAVRYTQHGYRLINTYGLTETVIANLANIYPGDGSTPTLGHPFSYVGVDIWDEHNQSVPPGLPGQIVLSGALARGYTDRELTNARFVTREGTRYYFTGDRGRQDSDGTFSFEGRIDDGERKVGGFRVNLRTIEAALVQHPDGSVRECAVVVRDSPAKEPCLVAYVVFSDRATKAPRELHSCLEEQLPAYMIPALFVVLDALPVNENGKRATLLHAYPEPDWAAWLAPGFASDAAIRIPGTATEAEVAGVLLTLRSPHMPADLATVDMTKTLKQLRIDSRKVGAFMMKVAQVFGVRLDGDELNLPLSDMAAMIAERRTR